MPVADRGLAARVRSSPVDVKRRYRQFADREAKWHSDLYYRLALAVADDDEMVDFIADMPVVQPNLFLACVQFLTGPETMPRSAA